MIKCWEGMESYEEFVKKEWQAIKVEGWKDHFDNLDTLITKVNEELNSLDLKGECGVLTEEEITQRRLCLSKIK